MPWDRQERRGTVGELLRIARESRGLSFAEAVAAFHRPHLFIVRRGLDRTIADRALSRSLDDAAIMARAGTIDELFIRKWEVDALGPLASDPLLLPLASAAYDYPVTFFAQTDQWREPIIVHINGTVEATCVVCGFVADYQCDYPIKRGKRCDLDLCTRHAIVQGDAWNDRHYCPDHAALGQLPLGEQG